mgnify:CR=1 FL=1
MKIPRKHFQLSESVILGGLAIIVGLTSGAGMWLFKWLIDQVKWLTFDQLGVTMRPLGGWTVMLLPILGGLIVGLLRHYFIGEERHHGVAGIMEAVALAGGRLRYKRIPIKTVAAAIAIGSGASVGPEDPSVQIGSNLGSIEGILQGEDLGIALLLGLMVAKLILTPVSIAGGFPGGVFAPSLFIGAALGGAFGKLANQLFPQLSLHPAAFAMVGMAALLAGAVHAPLTAILLLFEMTHDYRIILPLMFSVVISLLIAQRLQRDSVYTLGLARKGIRLERGRDVDVLETVTVAEVMQPAPFMLYEGDTLAKASELLIQTHRHGVPVLDAAGKLAGIFTLQDLNRHEPGTWRTRLVGDSCTHQLIVTYPDESIGAALRKMGARDIGRLPVVARNQPDQLVGVLRRSDLVRAYDGALTRRAKLRHSAHQVRLDALTPEAMQVVEVTVAPGSACADKPIKAITWPAGAIVASIQRKQNLLIPHGDTILRAGDVLAIVADESALEAVKALDNPE